MASDGKTRRPQIELRGASSTATRLRRCDSTLTVARGQAATRTITYRFIDIPDPLTSTGGEFLAGIDTVGTNSNVIGGTPSGGVVLITESLVIPAAVIEAALAWEGDRAVGFALWFSNYSTWTGLCHQKSIQRSHKPLRLNLPAWLSKTIYLFQLARFKG